LAEAIGERALKLKQLATQLGEMKGQVNVLGLLSKGSLTLETLQEPHKSMAKRLSTTRIMAAISAGQGSAMALVSRGEGYMSIDLIATNPSYMVASETAEVAHALPRARTHVAAFGERICAHCIEIGPSDDDRPLVAISFRDRVRDGSQKSPYTHAARGQFKLRVYTHL